MGTQALEKGVMNDTKPYRSNPEPLQQAFVRRRSTRIHPPGESGLEYVIDSLYDLFYAVHGRTAIDVEEFDAWVFSESGQADVAAVGMKCMRGPDGSVCVEIQDEK
jgi:hypothetical protein